MTDVATGMAHLVGVNVAAGTDTEGDYTDVSMSVGGRYLSGKLPGGTRSLTALKLLERAVLASMEDGPQLGG